MMRPILSALALLVVGAAAPPPTIPPAAPVPVAAKLLAIDFSLDWHQYLGKRVSVLGGQFIAASTEHGQFNLPGGVYAQVEFQGVPRSLVKYLILTCDGFKGNEYTCGANVTGVVGKSTYFDTPTLSNATITLPLANVTSAAP